MKNTLTLLAALFLVTVAVQAQTQLPGDPTATSIGTISTTTPVSVDYQGTTKGTDIAHIVVVWRTTTGAIALTLNTPSIEPSSSDVDYISTKAIFSQISRAAVAEAIRLGYIESSQTVKLWHESNVVRNNSGTATRFAACSTYTDISRNYVVTFSGENASIDDQSGLTYPSGCADGGSLQ